MFGKIFWKLLLSFLLLTWAVLELYPWKDVPFRDSLQSQATVKVEEFGTLLGRADQLVEEGAYPSVYLALKDLGQTESIDYAEFFPDIRVKDVKNLKRRNEILLSELLKRSHSKIRKGLDLEGGVSFTLRINENSFASDEAYIKKQKLSKAIDIMGKRVNGLGVAEPLIREKGEDSIEIQLPGLSLKDNPEAISALKKPARLEFRMVHRGLRPNEVSEDEYPLGYEVLVEERMNEETGDILEVPYFVKRVPEATGEIVSNSVAVIDPYGSYQISLSFTPVGSKAFQSITGKIASENERTNTVGQLAIVLDGKLYSAPTVREEIRGGASISGNFSQRDAIELANVLNNPLEFELKVEEVNEVGPSLAEDARSSSIKACLLGAGLVVAFMILYYGVAGVIAVISVAFNIVLVLGVLASLHSTLTLPGIAALVVTVGMAVDANILIFERIREELKLGKSLPSALLGGYEKAFSTIIDANVTTLITAVILIYLGTGPVKGFGVTLAVGIVASIFCALVVSRVMLDLIVDTGLIKHRLLLVSLSKEPKFDFFKYRKMAFGASWAIVIAGCFFLYQHRGSIYGVDFTGGDEVALSFESKVGLADIEAVAGQNDFGQLMPLYQKLIGEGKEVLKVQTEFGRGAEVVSVLQQEFPDAQFVELSTVAVGPTVGDEIKWNAIISLGVALLGVLLYIAFRFELGYGIGAIISIIHDVLMSVGIYVMLGGQFTAPMVASVLMIVGYSINDKIVVFDRIREELDLNPSMSLSDIINLSVNKTLSRTLLTSVTTLMATLALYLFGAGVIDDFALVFMAGIVTGTFSSIFIASPIFHWWHKGDKKHVQKHEFLPKYEWDSGSKASR